MADRATSVGEQDSREKPSASSATAPSNAALFQIAQEAEDNAFKAYGIRMLEIDKVTFESLKEEDEALDAYDHRLHQLYAGEHIDEDDIVVARNGQPISVDVACEGMWFKKPFTSVLGLPVLSTPHNICYRVWTWYMLLLDLVYTAFVFPFAIAFIEFGDRNSYFIEVVIGASFISDVFINMHVVYAARCKYDKFLITRGHQILQMYIKYGSFWIDFFASVPWLVVAIVAKIEGGSLWVITLVQLLRLTRLIRVLAIIRRLFQGTYLTDHGRGYVGVNTIYLLSIAYCCTVTINLLACMWYYTAYRGHLDENTWVGHAGGLGDIADSSTTVRYITSLYYVVTTITTTGYGDIIAMSTGEQIVAMVCMLCGALFISFIIGTIVQLLTQAGRAAKRATMYREKMQTVDSLMTAQGVTNPMRRRVSRFYQDVWLRHQEEVSMWKGVLEDLTPRLKAQLLAEILGPSVFRLGPFRGIDRATMQMIAGGLELELVMPDAHIFLEGDPLEHLYLLSEGAVMCLRGLGEQALGEKVEAPALLGVVAMRRLQGPEADTTQPCTVRALKPCTLWSLTSHHMRLVLGSMEPGAAGLLKERLISTAGRQDHLALRSHVVARFAPGSSKAGPVNVLWSDPTSPSTKCARARSRAGSMTAGRSRFSFLTSLRQASIHGGTLQLSLGSDADAAGMLAQSGGLPDRRRTYSAVAVVSRSGGPRAAAAMADMAAAGVAVPAAAAAAAAAHGGVEGETAKVTEVTVAPAELPAVHEAKQEGSVVVVQPLPPA